MSVPAHVVMVVTIEMARAIQIEQERLRKAARRMKIEYRFFQYAVAGRFNLLISITGPIGSSAVLIIVLSIYTENGRNSMEFMK